MKYKIKCKECGKLFHVDAHPNEKVKCKCPYCGKVMSCIMALPVVGARSIKQVTSRRMLKDSNGNPLPVVELYAGAVAVLVIVAYPKSQLLSLDISAFTVIVASSLALVISIFIYELAVVFDLFLLLEIYFPLSFSK